MAQNIYDEDGRKVGTIKSEKEKLDDDWNGVVDNIGCLAIIVFGILVFFCSAPWFSAIILVAYEGEMLWLYIMIPAIIATILSGRKSAQVGHTTWGTFWRVLLIDIVAGMPGGIIAALIEVGHWEGEEIAEGIIVAIWFAVFPAAIVAWIAHRKRGR